MMLIADYDKRNLNPLKIARKKSIKDEDTVSELISDQVKPLQPKNVDPEDFELLACPKLEKRE